MKRLLLVLLLCGCGRVSGPSLDAGVDDAGTWVRFEPDLGVNWGKDGATFTVWAPNATAAWVELDGVSDRIALEAREKDLFSGTAPVQRGQRYRYTFTTPTGPVTRIDPYCRQLSDDRAWCTLIDPNAYEWTTTGFSRPARNHAIVYEIHIGTFGTFNEAKKHLPAIADLGVNVVELMPVNAFGGNPNGWGYNPQLYLAPKPAYGTADDLKGFIDEAHRLGIAVWHDTVLNHMDGWRQAPLACFDGHCPNNSWGIYFFAPGQYALTPWGPRPNYLEPRVTSMLLDSARQWLYEYRGDGFRVDSVSNIRAIDGNGVTPGGRDLLVQFNGLVREAGALSVAEDLKGWDAITKDSGNGGFGFDAQWDGFGYDISNLVVLGPDDGRDLGIIERALKGGFAGDPFARLLWTENHDTVGNGGARLPVKIDPHNPESFAGRRRSMIAGALLFTTPGVPMLFMGQESLSTTPFPDPPKALPPPTEKGNEVRAFYKDLIALRRSVPGLSGKEVQILQRHDGNKVLAFLRKDTVVVVNLRNKAYMQYDFGVPTGGKWNVRLDSDWRKYGADFGGGNPDPLTAVETSRDGKPYTLGVKLGAYGVVILSQAE